MKKFVKVLLVILCMLFALNGTMACKKTNVIFSEMNAMASKKYTVVDVVIDSTTENVALQAHYVYEQQESNTQVTYTYQVLNAFEQVDGVWTPTTEMISQKSGEAVIENNKVVSQTGDQPQGELTANSIKWNFNQKNFSEHKTSGNIFEGKVVDCSKLCGINIANATIKVEYKKNALKSIVLSGEIGSAKVVYTYTFTK